MSETNHESSLSKAFTFLGDVWRGVNAPEDVISKTRKRIDEAMVATGTLGIAESYVLKSPAIFAVSVADFSIGAADLARAGREVRKHDHPEP